MLETMPVAFYLVNGLTVLFLLIASGLVSGSEVAFFSLSGEQIEECSQSDNSSEPTSESCFFQVSLFGIARWELNP